jgi:CRP/FNR family transcriptional regulator, cyclic AMP receptor protein
MDDHRLVLAINSLGSEDAFKPRLGQEQWRLVQGYLSLHDIHAGELIAKQDDVDRTVFFLEEGSLQVFRSAPPMVSTGQTPPRMRIGLLRPGAIVGEAGLFGHIPRLANVESMTTCKVWALIPTRWDELCLRQPTVALEMLRAAGVVYATRMRMNLNNQVAFS